GRTESFSCLTSVWVRGQEVHLTQEAINSIYWDKSIPSHPIFCNKVEDKANQFQWVANLIAKGRAQWATSKGLVHRHDLKFETHMRLDLVSSRLMPSWNTSKVPIEVSILLACIMDNSAIKKALHPAKDKFASLYSTVDVLESEVGTLKQEVVALTAPPSISQPNPCEPEAVPDNAQTTPPSEVLRGRCQ
ncbi:hypothetical protein HAX54_014857, partial [Datura stramonium]|nr:hypothetical protein [Datura stramonium]